MLLVLLRRGVAEGVWWLSLSPCGVVCCIDMLVAFVLLFVDTSVALLVFMLLMVVALVKVVCIIVLGCGVVGVIVVGGIAVVGGVAVVLSLAIV